MGTKGKCQILYWVKEKAQGTGNFINTGISRDAAVEKPEPLGLFIDQPSDEVFPS